MGKPIPILDAAAELGVSSSTVHRWISSGAPVARRGGRGRGRATLVSVEALGAWRSGECDTEAVLKAFVSRVPELAASAVMEAFRMSEGPFKRESAAQLTVAWYLACSEIMEAAGIEPPEALPTEIERLLKISGQ